MLRMLDSPGKSTLRWQSGNKRGTAKQLDEKARGTAFGHNPLCQVHARLTACHIRMLCFSL